MLEHGEGTEPDPVGAWVWYRKAEVGGNVLAAAEAERLARILGEERLAEARTRLDEAGSKAFHAKRGLIAQPVLIPESKVLPIYPMDARVERVSGRVVLTATIDETGRVDDVEVLQVSRTGLGFEQAAIGAVSEWRYEPARVAGEPIAIRFTIVVDFQMRRH
jgi:TonB family protein